MAETAQLTCPDPGCDYHTKPGSRGPEFAMKAHMRMRHPEAAPGGGGAASEPSPSADATPPPGGAPGVDPGPAPSRKRRSLRERLLGPKRAPAEPSSTGEKPPRPAKWAKAKRGRTSVGPLFETVYGALGTNLAMGQGPNVAVGRTLVFQAPIVAARADDMVRGTIADRVVQPVAKMFDAGEDAFGIVGLPVFVWLWQAFPGSRRALNPMMRAAILANLSELVPAMKKAREQSAKLERDLEDLAPELFPGGVPPGPDGKPMDLVSAMLGNIFAGVETDTTDQEVSTNGAGREGRSASAAQSGGSGEAA